MAKIARTDRALRMEQEQTTTLHTSVAAAEQNDKDLRRMIEVKNKEITKHSHHLRKIVDEHSDSLAVFARRSRLFPRHPIPTHEPPHLILRVSHRS
jgi:hypothetical protein